MGLTGQAGHTPSLHHTLHSVTAGNGDGVDHLVGLHTHASVIEQWRATLNRVNKKAQTRVMHTYGTIPSTRQPDSKTNVQEHVL